MEQNKIMAAVPFHIEKTGEITTGGEVGFQPLYLGLRELGNRVRSEHQNRGIRESIPNVTAQIDWFHSAFEKKSDELGEQPEPQEELWRRIISLVVLSRYRSLTLRTERIRKQEGNKTWEILGNSIAKAVGMENGISVLFCGNHLIAVSDIHTIWTPAATLKNLDAEGIGGIETLEPYERELLAAYLDRAIGAGLECEVYLKRFRGSLGIERVEREIRWGETMEEVSRYWTKVTPEIVERLFFIPEPPEKVPYPFFPSLCLTSSKTFENSLSFSVKEDNGDQTTLTALLPLSLELMERMEQSDTVSLDTISIDFAQFLKSQELRVILQLKVGTDHIVYRKRYLKEQLRYVAVPPIVSVFPYIDVPPERWQDYNLILLPGEDQNIPGNMKSLQGIRSIDGSRIDIMNPTVCQSKAGDAFYRWYYAKAKTLPKYVGLCLTEDMQNDEKRNNGKERSYFGCVAVGKPLAQQCIQHQFQDKAFYWAIDLGTCNTIVASRLDEGDISYDLIYKDVYHPILDDNESARNLEFYTECYASAQSKNEKFRTMSRVYQSYNSGIQNRCYEHGCAIFPEPIRLIERIYSLDQLQNEQIYTDIKFSGQSGVRAVALYLYIGNMLWLGCLQAVLKGAETLHVMISYPRQEVYDIIRQVWEEVCIVMRQQCPLAIDLNFITEAEANYYYQNNTTRDETKRVGIANDFGIIDIGHGTADMNFYFHSERMDCHPIQLQLSLKHAGRELIVQTLMDYFAGRMDRFDGIWALPQEHDIEVTKLRRLAKENIRKITRQLSGSSENILITLLENIGFRKNLSATFESEFNQNLLAALKFKYMNLFLLYANILSSCPRLTASKTFKLYLYGGGRHGLQPVFRNSESMEQIGDSGIGWQIRSAIAHAMGIEIDHVSIISRNDTQKHEVAAGMLYKNQEEIRDVKTDRESIGGFLNYQEPAVEPGVWNHVLKEKLEAAYHAFIQFYKDNAEFYLVGKSIASAYWNVAITADRDSKPAIKAKVGQNRKYFEEVMPNIWNEISRDTENPTEVLYCLFCCRIADLLLLYNLR